MDKKIDNSSLQFLFEELLDHTAALGHGQILLVAHDGKHGGRRVDDGISQQAVQVPEEFK
jgi:hypothetical protein